MWGSDLTVSFHLIQNSDHLLLFNPSFQGKLIVPAEDEVILSDPYNAVQDKHPVISFVKYNIEFSKGMACRRKANPINAALDGWEHTASEGSEGEGVSPSDALLDQRIKLLKRYFFSHRSNWTHEAFEGRG